jgi:N-acetylglucosaminylphosphatidylinositol deacetylase
MEESRHPIFTSTFLFFKEHHFLLIIVFSIVLAVYFRAKKIHREFLNKIAKKLESVGEVLFVIAHPDDETIFFFPTIQALIAKKVKVNILCLSNGDFDRLGKIREEEMRILADYLKINSVEIVSNDKLKDDINKSWDKEIVSEEVSKYLSRNNNIRFIFTFDQGGVTKHPNHISCFTGIE